MRIDMGGFLLVTQSTQMSFFLAFNGVTKIKRYLCRLVSLNGKHLMLSLHPNFPVSCFSPSRLIENWTNTNHVFIIIR